MHATTRRAYRESLWGQLHYRVVGTATARPPLLCLHSTPHSGWQLEPILARMGLSRVTLAPDIPGYGASDAPPAPVAITDYAAAMLGLLDSLVAEGVAPDGRVDVLGYQTGSAIAVEMARLRPSRIRRIALISLMAYPPAERAAKLAQLKAEPPPADADTFLRVTWGRMQSVFDPRLNAQWKLSALADTLRFGPQRGHWAYQSLYKHDFERALDELIHEVLVINPEDELWNLTRQAARRIRNSFYVDLTGVSQGLFELEPNRLAALLLGFLDGRQGFTF